METTPLIKEWLIVRAREHDSWESFWAFMLNTAKGNVSSVLKGFSIAGVSTTDIEHAFLKLRRMKLKEEKVSISAGVVSPSGMIECKAYYYGELLTKKLYNGYTKREALKLFRQHVRETLASGIYGPRLY